MKTFVKTIIPSVEYVLIKQIGNRYLVHLDPIDNLDGTITCFEVTTNELPNLEDLLIELGIWKLHLENIELNILKKLKIDEIDAYDRSENVNSFTLGEVNMWLTVNERQQLATLISSNEAIGRTTMTRWFGGQSFTFPIETWKSMLTALEVYAGDALNVTEEHKAAVNSLLTIQDIEDFDITEGYPLKLVFS